MKARHVITSGLGGLVLWLVVPIAGAQWVQDGIPVCTAPGNQNSVLVTSDGRCGAIAAWRDYRAGNGDVYAQRIDRYGCPRWTTDGVPVCTLASTQTFTGIAGDGHGGAFVVWEDHRADDGGNIYLQRLDANGSPCWQANGIAVCSEIAAQVGPVVVADGSGGAIVAWVDLRDFTGIYKSIYAQRIRADGTRVFAANGVAVASGLYARDDLHIASDEHGGAYLCWRESSVDLYGDDCNDLLAARIDATGSVVMPTTTLYLGITLPTGRPAGDLEIVSAGNGGAFFAWYDWRSSSSADIYAQYIDAGGSVRWTSNGKTICNVAGSQFAPELAVDGAGGVFIIWEDYASYPDGWPPDLTAQRVSADGSVLWAANGIGIVHGGYRERLPRLIPDGAGGAVAVWQNSDPRPEGAADLLAQRITPDGATVWPGHPTFLGFHLCQLVGAQQYAAMVTNHAGGAVVAWEDWRTETEPDVYAQWLGPDASRELPRPVITTVDDVADDQGRYLRLTVSASAWDSPRQAERPVIHYSIWRRLAAVVDQGTSDPDGLPPGAWECLGSQPAAQTASYVFNVAASAAADATSQPWEIFAVTAHTDVPALFFCSYPDSGYALDDLAPATPAEVVAVADYEPLQLLLAWQANHESDLVHYAVYRGLDPDFIPSESNRIGTPTNPVFSDDEWRPAGGFHYKISAFDRHDNESGHALVRPEDVTGIPGSDVPARTRLVQTRPNPFNPTTCIVYDLHAPGHVELRIYDAAGRLVRTLVDGQRAAARHEEHWDGIDATGQPVGSGVYFCRLRNEGGSDTVSMALVR